MNPNNVLFANMKFYRCVYGFMIWNCIYVVNILFILHFAIYLHFVGDQVQILLYL